MADKSTDKSVNDTSKKVPGVSSRLLQATASSAARSGQTPTLTRKFGSATNSRQTPTTSGASGSRFGSGRKVFNSSTKSNGTGTKPKIVASSAKKLVMNSTSESENVIPPEDWDASAIVSPNETSMKSKIFKLLILICDF